MSKPKTVQQNRKKVAAKFAEGDDLLASVIEFHLEYIQDLKPRPQHREQGIDFYVVGHNASHVYHLGVKDGEMWKYVIGESSEMDEDGFPKIESKTYKSDGFGYCGHF
jgi:hypothetical protein